MWILIFDWLAIPGLNRKGW